ncbi:MAG: GNAT family N-acetyltransferase [Lachnospiraceae bacterium]|nr:GNAT family N-acetyltransferase [Lachnospiraceae bacterium]
MECTIRKWNLSDANDLASMLNNTKILNNLRDGLPYPYTVENARQFITEMLAADPQQTFAFAIACENRVIGSIGVFRCANIHFRTAEMGYYIGEPYWGKGLMTSAVRQTCQYIFEHTDILRIFAEPFARNTASCRVLEKAGFQFEGLLRQNAIKNGQILDMKLYARIKETKEIRETDVTNEAQSSEEAKS